MQTQCPCCRARRTARRGGAGANPRGGGIAVEQISGHIGFTAVLGGGENRAGRDKPAARRGNVRQHGNADRCRQRGTEKNLQGALHVHHPFRIGGVILLSLI